MSLISADTNLFVYAANPSSPLQAQARQFLQSCGEEFVLCELVLVELYLLLRNPAIFATPYSAQSAADYCEQLKRNPKWRCVDYDPQIASKLWRWARGTQRGYRAIIDARMAFTLQHHGVTQFATANEKDFQDLGFERVWNPLEEALDS